MNRWLRFGQPIGSALITLAVLDTILNCFLLLLQYSGLERDYFAGVDFNQEFYNHLLWHFLIALRVFLSVVLWVTVFWGKNTLLVTWLLLSILNDSGMLAFVIRSKFYNNYGNYENNENIWEISFLKDPWPLSLSIGVFLLFRLYMLSVGFQGVWCLHREYDHSRCRSVAEDISDIDVCLEPIGFGFCQTWEFYKDLPGMGAVILLVAETTWNMEHLGVRELFAFMLDKSGRALLQLEIGQEVTDYVFLEDNVMRCTRIFLALVGIYFFYKEQLNFVRLWILVYLVALVCSNVIFGMTVVAKGVHWIVFHSICIVFDTLYRLLVLYFSCKFAIVHRRTIIKS